MRPLFFLLVMASLLTFSSCQNKQAAGEDTSTDTFDPSIIQGTWEMTHIMPGDTNTVVPVDFKQYKFFTGNRYFLIRYDKDSIRILGGGTYTIDENTFTENFEFFSLDFNDIPTSLTFNHKIEGDQFIQTGVIPGGGDDNEDYQLEEHYKKVEASILADTDHPYLGLWKMEQAQNGDAKEVQTVPDPISRMKIITPGHFFIVSWRKNNLMPGAAVFGSQKVENGKYVETVIANTMNSNMNGTIIPYNAEGGDSSFRMHGDIPMDEGNYKIDERYSRVE